MLGGYLENHSLKGRGTDQASVWDQLGVRCLVETSCLFKLAVRNIGKCAISQEECVDHLVDATPNIN